MRRRIVAEAAARRAPVFRPFPALAASAAVVLLVAIGWSFLRPELPMPAPTAGAETAVAPATAESERRTRQVQFSTPGGTRVIWLLDSEFGV
jgi:hypothetical protein